MAANGVIPIPPAMHRL